MDDSNSSHRFKDSVAISIGGKVMFVAIILLFLTVVFAVFLHIYYRRLRRNGHSQRGHRFVFNADRHPILPEHGGLEPKIIQSLPLVIFHPNQFKDSPECAVCLSELSQGEKVRLLPNCNHGFHLDCIDMWFQSHSTCPLCRTQVAFDSQQVQAPIVNSGEGSSSELRDAPTNVSCCGTADRATADSSALNVEHKSSSCSLTSASLEGNGMLVIDIPRQLPQSFLLSSSSSIHPEEELKSPATTRMRSLKRLLSREKRVIACSSPTGVDVEEGRKVQNKKEPTSDSQ